MTNPNEHGFSGYAPDGGYSGFVSRMGRSSPHAPVVSGTNTSAASSSSLPLSRLSHLLNPPHDSTHELYSTHHSAFRNPEHNNNNNHNFSSNNSGSMERDGSSVGPGGVASGPPSRTPQLPSFSRAFEMFMSPMGDNVWGNQKRYHGFFTPSYLRGSDYVQKLESAHRAKEAQKEANLQSSRGSGIQSSSVSTPAATRPGSHMGMTYDLIERPPALDDDEAVPSLPSQWNKDDKSGGLEVLSEGQEIKLTTSKPTTEREYEISSIRSNHPVPAQAGIYYFEVAVLSKKRDETTVCVGFAAKPVPLNRPTGWENDAYGYHGDDGQIYHASTTGKHYGPPYTTGDTIGCGINFLTGTIFYTRNGVHLGDAFKDVKGVLYPVVAMKRSGEHVRVNFGHTPFVYDIDGMMRKEQNEIRKAISEVKTDKLSPSAASESELIQQLVLQFLQHDGYVETARAFAEEIQGEKKALNVDRHNDGEGADVADDEDANRRQRIRRAILEGDVDKAFKYMTIFYPDVLKENEQIYFKLRCRKFVEMVRKSAEMNPQNNGSSKQSNGHSIDGGHNEMDLDENGVADSMETEDGVDFPVAGEEALLANAIAYGKELQEEFKADPRREVRKAMDEAFLLLAYPNPFQAKEVSHLLDRKGRQTVAEELNAVILTSLGKSSRSALENLWSQTSVLLSYLREDGGPGAFVTIQSVVDEIPKSPPY